ncbi:MAG TPA: hypothetical protein VLT47_07180 [Anaeromyxobacteraceae bacterium]|nr:hypothetical protein [Anaeromyxobacteraceae bacterium]
MSVHTALAVSAFGASIVLFLAHANRGLLLVALAASGLEVLMAFGLIALHVSVSVPLQLILGALIAVPAVLVWLRASSKASISAATVLTLVGALQVWLAILR